MPTFALGRDAVVVGSGRAGVGTHGHQAPRSLEGLTRCNEHTRFTGLLFFVLHSLRFIVSAFVSVAFSTRTHARALTHTRTRGAVGWLLRLHSDADTTD